MRSPGSFARYVAGREWGAIQHQRKVCRGVFWFDTASHGGLVAVLDQLDVPAEAIAVARKHELVVTVRDSGGTVIRPGDVTRTDAREVWIGEEDCAYATLALVSEPVRDGLGVTRQDAYECVRRWHEPFLADVEPGYVPLIDGQIRHAERRQRIFDAGGVLLRAAWGDWADGVPPNHVRVLFGGADDREESYIMHEDVYDARGSFRFRDPTPQDFAALGVITLETERRAA